MAVARLNRLFKLERVLLAILTGQLEITISSALLKITVKFEGLEVNVGCASPEPEALMAALVMALEQLEID